MVPLRILAIAVVSRHVACVCLAGDRIIDWRISDSASRSPQTAVVTAEGWIDSLEPDVVVTEDPDTAQKKGAKSKHLTRTIADMAKGKPVSALSITRERSFKNKYEEAAALVERYAELRHWVPSKRRIQDNEPRNAVLFEALALAEIVRQSPAITLAAAMG